MSTSVHQLLRALILIDQSLKFQPFSLSLKWSSFFVNKMELLKGLNTRKTGFIKQRRKKSINKFPTACIFSVALSQLNSFKKRVLFGFLEWDGKVLGKFFMKIERIFYSLKRESVEMENLRSDKDNTIIVNFLQSNAG